MSIHAPRYRRGSTTPSAAAVGNAWRSTPDGWGAHPAPTSPTTVPPQPKAPELKPLPQPTVNNVSGLSLPASEGGDYIHRVVPAARGDAPPAREPARPRVANLISSLAVNAPQTARAVGTPAAHVCPPARRPQWVAPLTNRTPLTPTSTGSDHAHSRPPDVVAQPHQSARGTAEAANRVPPPVASHAHISTGRRAVKHTSGAAASRRRPGCNAKASTLADKHCSGA